MRYGNREFFAISPPIKNVFCWYKHDFTIINTSYLRGDLLLSQTLQMLEKPGRLV